MVELKAAARLRAQTNKVEAAPNQNTVIRALKQLGFYPRKIVPDGDSVQITGQNDAGEIFLTLDIKSLQVLKAMFAKDANLRLSFYTVGAAQMGISVASDTSE